MEKNYIVPVKLEEKTDIEARVSIDLQTGDYTTFRRWQVVNEIEEDQENSQILVSSKIAKDNNLGVEDWYEEQIESIKFGTNITRWPKNNH